MTSTPRKKKWLFEVTEYIKGEGFTFWAQTGKDRRWILDASCFDKDKSIRLDLSRFKVVNKSRKYFEIKFKEAL